MTPAPVAPTAAAPTAAPVQMTRAEYQAKYGATPQVSVPAAPVQMTRADYEAKYGIAPAATPAPASPATAPASPAKPDLLDKAAGTLTSIFPGTKEIGNALGTAAFNATQIPKAITTPGAYKSPFADPNIPAQIGGEVQAGSTILSLAAPIPRAATALGSAAKAALQTGALGTAMGAGQALTQDKPPKEIAADAFKTGLAGTVLGGIAGAATKGLSNLVSSSKAPEALYNNALKVLQRIKLAGKSPSSFLADEGVWGGLGTFHKAAQDGMAEEGAKIATKAAATPGGLTYAEIRDQAVKELGKEFDSLYSAPELKAMIERVPIAALRDAKDIVPWAQVDKTRSALGGLIGDNKWLAANPADSVKASQAVYRVIARNLQKATDTTTEFARLSKWVSTNKVVKRAIGLADSKYGLGLYDLLSGTGGAIAGGLATPGDIGTRVKNAALGGLGGLALERGINSPALKTGLAQLLPKAAALSTGTAEKVGRAGLTRLLGN